MQTYLEIKKYLNENGISLTFVSKKTGIPLASLSLSLAGKRKISLDEYERICGALGVSVDRFLTARVVSEQ